MQTNRIRVVFPVFFVLISVMCMIGLVSAVNGTVSIAYRGAGGNYLGDTIIFDGKNTVGNMTVLKISGPGLPDAGVPLYDITGIPGSGNTVKVDANGNWFFSWDTNRIKGSDLLQTVRYTFTAFDRDHPEKSGTTSVILKRPEFYIIASQNPAAPGDYVQLTGNAEKGVSFVRIDVTDSTGKVLHTFMSPVSASGYFQYGFHVDMQPGQYNVVVSNPSMKSGLNQILTIAVPKTPVPVQTSPAPGYTTTGTATPSPETTVAGLPLASPTSIPLSPLCAIAGFIGAIALFWTTGRKNL